MTLEDDADGLIAVPRQLFAAHRAQVASIGENRTGGWPIQARQQIEQR